MTYSLQVIDKMRVSASKDPNTILTEIVVPWQERAPRTYSGLVPTNLALSFQPFVLRIVLVQPEMESWRSRLASIPPFSPGRPVPSRFLKTSDSLRIVAGAARRPALFPQLFPIPDPVRVRHRESELMREHTHLPAMMGFVRKHVAQHFQANRPRPSPAVSAKLLDAAPTTAERFSEHLRAASAALGQSRAGLLRRAVRAVELCWNLQMRSCKPDPLAADIVHVREDRCNSAGVVFSGVFAGRFGCRRSGTPGGRVKMFDKNLVDAIVGEKDPGGKVLDCGSAELSVNLVLMRGHGSLL